MRARHYWEASAIGKSSTTSRVFVGGISSLAVILVATAGTGAFQSSEQSSVEKTETNSSVESSVDIDNFLEPSDQVPLSESHSESYTQSSDGTSQTRQYRSVTQDENGNQTTQEQTYTTNIDGSSAIDINLKSTSSSTSSTSSSSSASVNSDSSVRMNVNSRSEVRSSD